MIPIRYPISEIVFTCDDGVMNTREPSNKEVASSDSDENTAFDGAELSESVLARDWNSPEEGVVWSNL